MTSFNCGIFGMGPVEFIIILLIAFVLLVILGPKNLPKLGNSIGKAIKGLRDGLENSDNKEKEVETVETVIENDKEDNKTKTSEEELDNNKEK